MLGGNANAFGSATNLEKATKIGIRAHYRTVDEDSPDGEYLDGMNDFNFMTVLYFAYQF